MQNKLEATPMHGVDKKQEGYLRSKGSEPHTRLPSPMFKSQEDKSL